MSSTGEITDAVRLAQRYNIVLYRYLINGLVDNSLAVSQLKVEFDEYTRSSMKFFDRLRDSKIPFVRVRQEQINVFQEQVKINDKLKLEVHKIQRGLWTCREKGQQVPMANKYMIIHGFPELCVSTSPDKVPLTVLCEQIIRKYNIRKERSIAAMLKLIKEENISRQTSNTAPVGPCQNQPQLVSVRPAQPNIQPAVPVTESHDVTPVMSCDDSTKEPVQPVTLPHTHSCKTEVDNTQAERTTTSKCIQEKKQEAKPDYKTDDFPFTPRKYPLFSIDELFEMFLKPRNRNSQENLENPSTASTPEKRNVEVNPENMNAAPKPENTTVTEKPASTDITIKQENINETTKPPNINVTVEPVVSLTTDVEEHEESNFHPNNVMIHSALQNEIQKTKMEIQRLQGLIASERRHGHENKTNRVPHASKKPADNMTPAESLQYQQKREDQFTSLELKKQRMKNALNQQCNKPWDGKATVHYYKVQDAPKIEKPTWTTAPTVPSSYQPTAKVVNQLPVRPNTVSPSHTNQMSRKRPFSTVDTVSSVPAAKRARQEPCILQKMFQEKSDWDDEQGIDRN